MSDESVRDPDDRVHEDPDRPDDATDAATLGELPIDADPADVLDQHRAVPLDDDDHEP